MNLNIFMLVNKMFENENNPLLLPEGDLYKTIGGITEGIKGRRIVFDIKGKEILDLELVPENLRDEYIKKVLKERDNTNYKLIEEDPELFEHYLDWYSSLGKEYLGRGKWPDTPRWSVEGVSRENEVTWLKIRGKIPYSTFIVMQKGKGSLREKITSDPYSKEGWGLPNPPGVSPALILVDEKEGKFYTLFGERGRDSDLAAGALGILGGGIAPANYNSLLEVALQELKEEVPEGIINHITLRMLGEDFVGKNPISWHLETLQLMEGKTAQGYENRIKEVKKGLYIVTGEVVGSECEIKEHENIYLVEVHPDNKKLLEDIARGKGVVEGHTYKWAKPHAVAYMTTVDTALKEYFN